MGLLERAAGGLNRTLRRNGQPVQLPLSTVLPRGSWRTWAHYGVMIPNLPAPHSFYSCMSVVGTPGVPVFSHDELITTTPRDTAYLVTGTGAPGAGLFRAYSVAQDCEFAADGTRERFGADLELGGSYPDFTLHAHHGGLDLEATLTATGAITYFVDIPGVYQHWSVLCEASGEVRWDGATSQVSGLCTFEYALGAGTGSFLPGALQRQVKIPARFFTYQIINISADTQVLLVQVLGPAGVLIMRTCYVRAVDGSGREYRQQCQFEVRQTQAVGSPAMKLPVRLGWTVTDPDGGLLLEIEGVADGNWVYGLGVGYVGSYRYQGRFRGAEVAGSAYIEYIDLLG